MVAALLGVALLLGCFPMADFDVWWHLRAGQMVLQSGHLPRVDDWTYTNAGRPWIDLYWLVMPELTTSRLPLGVAEIGCCLGLAAIFCGGLIRLAGGRSLVPAGDPRLSESLAFQNM